MLSWKSRYLCLSFVTMYQNIYLCSINPRLQVSKSYDGMHPLWILCIVGIFKMYNKIICLGNETIFLLCKSDVNTSLWVGLQRASKHRISWLKGRQPSFHLILDLWRIQGIRNHRLYFRTGIGNRLHPHNKTYNMGIPSRLYNRPKILEMCFEMSHKLQPVPVQPYHSIPTER